MGWIFSPKSATDGSAAARPPGTTRTIARRRAGREKPGRRAVNGLNDSMKAITMRLVDVALSPRMSPREGRPELAVIGQEASVWTVEQYDANRGEACRSSAD